MSEAFLYRQRMNSALISEIRENEEQLQFLERQIKEQVDISAKQNAAISLTNHNLSKAATEVENYIHEEFDDISNRFGNVDEQHQECISIS